MGREKRGEGANDSAPNPEPGASDNRKARRATAAAAAAAAAAAREEAAAAAAAAGPEDEGREKVEGLVGFDMLSEELWLQVLHALDGRSLCAAACACAGLSSLASNGELWAGLHAQLFGGGEGCGGAAAAQRERVCQSEAQLDSWRRVGRGAPLSLPLPGMTGAALLGPVGVSTHGGRLVRLWEARTGRRLAAHIHKHELSACAGAAGVVAVGDVAGGVHVYGVESDFSPLLLPRGAGPVTSLALLPLHADRAPRVAVVAASGGGGSGRCEVSVSVARCEPWPPLETARSVLGIAELAAGGSGAVSLAAGPSGCVCAGSGCAVALYDLEAAAGGGAGGAQWSAHCEGVPPAVQPWRSRTALLAAAEEEEGASQLADSLGARLALQADGAPTGGAGGAGGGGGREGGAAGGAAPAPSRLLSYSPSWRLLAAGMEGGVVALWDVRLAGDRGCAAAVQAGGAAGWVHLDEGQGLAGHLLVSPSSGDGLHIYDVRRVGTARAPSAALPVSTLATPVGCFAAEGPLLVVGGGHKSAEAWRFKVGSLPAGAPDEEEALPRGAKPRAKPARNLPAQCFKRRSRPQ